jgi:hypothetical protein
MKYLILAAALLATPAFAADPEAPQPPPVAAAPAQPEPPKVAPAPATVWAWTDMDAGDLNNLTACSQELPKRVADQWINRFASHIKPVR